MKILNMYFSSTGNTKKVALRIAETAEAAGHEVDTIPISEQSDLDLLAYDLVFAGSGVYEWLPGQAVIKAFTTMRKKYVKAGAVKPSSPRLPGKKAVVYCTYGGAHTGVNEAVPAVKYMAQLFDHLGFDILAEWYLVGEYVPEKFGDFNKIGRMGAITGRPHAEDLSAIAEQVNGVLKM